MNTKLIARRIVYAASLTTVAGTAAYASYGHMRDLALLGHQSPQLAGVLPLSVDGMMVVATLAIAEDKAQGRRPRTWARVALGLGALVSVAANIASTLVHFGDPLSVAVAAWPPIALFVVTEVMSKRGKLIATATATATAAATATVPAPIAPPVVAATPAPVIVAPVIVRRPAVPAGARFLPIAPRVAPAILAAVKTPRPRVAAATSQRRTATVTTDTAGRSVNPRTGQPYSERQDRRLRTGR